MQSKALDQAMKARQTGNQKLKEAVELFMLARDLDASALPPVKPERPANDR